MVLVIQKNHDERFEEVDYLHACLCTVLFLIASLLNIVVSFLLILVEYLAKLLDDVVDNPLVENLHLVAHIVDRVHLQRLQVVQERLVGLERREGLLKVALKGLVDQLETKDDLEIEGLHAVLTRRQFLL